MFRRLALLTIAIGILAVGFGPSLASAQVQPATTFSLESIDIGLGGADLKETVINIIRFVLGFMTLVAIVFIIYGGFTWLTAGGNEDRVEQAKRIISAAVIGMIVILLAWAIVLFVANTTANVTQP